MHKKTDTDEVSVFLFLSQMLKFSFTTSAQRLQSVGCSFTSPTSAVTVQQRSHVSPSAFVITIAACSSLIACSGASAKEPATSKSETMNNCSKFSWIVSSNAFRFFFYI